MSIDDPMLAADNLAAEHVPAYAVLQQRLRDFQDAFAAALPDRALIDGLAADLEAWTARLREVEVDEAGQVFAHEVALPVRGHAMVPPYVETYRDESRVEGTVRFGRWFIGGRGAVHGGAIALLFDEVVGVLAALGPLGWTRTAYLKVDFRALTEVERDLTVRAWVDREEGRKRYLRGQVLDGDVVTAEAEGLFVVLRPGQR